MDTITSIPLDQLHESPFNPRRTFGEAGLAELAADFRVNGVMSPLLVRPRVPELFRGTDQADAAAVGYEIVFGHRRFRAAALAELASVPCMVRALDDAQASRMQIGENLAREDLHPAEEAEGFAALINGHNVTVDQLIDQTGKSRSYIYGRLKLAYLSDVPRKAYLAGEISTEIALYIARLPSAKMQQQAMSTVKEQSYHIGMGERNIRRLLLEKFTLGLKDAIFDVESAELLPAAGACTACPKLSGNAPEFADLAGGEDGNGKPAYYGHRGPQPRACTDPDCFAAKKTQHLRNKAAELEASGKSVINGAKARTVIGADGAVKGDYVKASEFRAAIKKAAGDKKPVIQTAIDQRTGKTVDVVKRSDLVDAGVLQAEAKGKSKQESSSESWEVQRKRKEELAAKRTAANLRLFQAVRARQEGAAFGIFELRFMAHSALLDAEVGDDMDHLLKLRGANTFGDLENALEAYGPDDLARLMLDIAMSRDLQADGWQPKHQLPAGLLQMAEHYGIDAAAATADEPAPTPASAVRASKKAPAAPAKKKAKRLLKTDDAGAPDEPELSSNDPTSAAGAEHSEEAEAGA